jgi:hypothetical protein
VQAGDPRADPAVVDLIELAGLWLAAGDRAALRQTLSRLIGLLEGGYAADEPFIARFRAVLTVAERPDSSDEDVRRAYRRATFG